MPIWENVAIRIGAILIVGAAVTIAGWGARALSRDPDARIWVQILLLVAICCLPLGIILATVGSFAAANRPAGLATSGLGLVCAVGGLALSQRRPRPATPGTEESFTPQETGAAAEPEIVMPPQRASVGTDERVLIVSPGIFSMDDMRHLAGPIVLTDRALWLGTFSIPRDRVRTITYSKTKDRITIQFAEEKGVRTIWLGARLSRGGAATGTYRLFTALRTGFNDPDRLMQPLMLKPVPGWKLAATSSLAATALLVAVVPLYQHGAFLQQEATAYQSSPSCRPPSVINACRDIESGVLAEVGAGRHPDGKPGATTWLAIGSGRTTIYADSPEHLTLTDFHPGDPVTFERYGGTLTRASADGISLTTYDNPSWTASNFWILFDMVAGAAALMMAASAALWIRYFRRPHPDDMLADGSSGSFELAS